jgi:cytochrome P450
MVRCDRGVGQAQIRHGCLHTKGCCRSMSSRAPAQARYLHVHPRRGTRAPASFRTEGRAHFQVMIWRWARSAAKLTFLATRLMRLLGAQYAADAPAIARAAHEAMREFTAYLTALIGERRTRPRDDLLSTLITATGPDGSLDDEELILNCMALLNAGLERTAASACTSPTWR